MMMMMMIAEIVEIVVKKLISVSQVRKTKKACVFYKNVDCEPLMVKVRDEHHESW